MIQKFVLLFIIFQIIFLFSPDKAVAHTLKTDGTIGAVLHVSPDDDPIAGVTTDFFFELKDTQNTLTPKNCDCIATVLQNGKEIYTQPLFQTTAEPSLDDASFAYVLPQKDIYTIQISGRPTYGASFEPFTLSWNLRVARDSSHQASSNSANLLVTALPYVIGFIAVLVFAGIVFGSKKNKLKK